MMGFKRFVELEQDGTGGFGLIADGSNQAHTSYLSREPREYPCKFFLAGVNFYRFNAKNGHFSV